MTAVRSILAAASLAVATTTMLSGCQCGSCQRVDADVESAAHEAHQAYVDAINSNDVERMLAMLTDDVVFLPPNSPVMIGKETLRPWLEGYVAAFRTHWDKPVHEFVVNGCWAFERYSYTSTDTPRDGGDAIVDTGWGLIIYRHDADGVWRVARDAWGMDHP